MKLVAQKTYKTLFLVTLITLCVTPVFASAQITATQILSGANQTINGVNNLITGFTLAPLTLSLYTIMTIVAALLGFAGLILDAIINLTVVNLSTTINNISSINVTWSFIRDLANMSFIFILLYEGIRMIVGLEGSGIKKVISNIIIVAILVNFSIFGVKVVIDASNIITLGFYKIIVTESNFGITGAYMSVLRILSLYTPSGSLRTIFSGFNGVFALIGNIVFMSIAAFIFLTIAAMFFIRYLSFILLLILSPLALASMAVPGLSSFKDKYVTTLISQALFAPVFMILTWIMFTLLGDTNFLKGPANKTIMDALMTPGSETINLIIDYLLIIGLLLYTLILSKQVATKGGFVTNSMINKGAGLLGGAVFGGAAYAGREIIGKRADALANNEDLQKRADQGDLGARLTLWGAKKTASSSFDARRSFVGEKASSFMGVDMGTGVPWNSDAGKGGYAGAKAAKKKETEGKLDEIIKRYKDKEDWSKLAEVFKERSADDQKYMYKSLSAKERIGLEIALDGSPGGAKGKVLRDTLKSKEEKEKTEEEAIRHYSKGKDWKGLVSYFNQKDPADNAGKQFIYTTLSARDRVAFGKELNNASVVKTLNDALSAEEKDKTKEAEKKVQRQERDEQHINDIEALVDGTNPPINPATNAPYTYDELFSKTFSTKNARNLSEKALQNPEVIKHLKPEHLKDIRENADISDATRQAIWSVVIGPTPYPNQAKQFNGEISKNNDYWY